MRETVVATAIGFLAGAAGAMGLGGGTVLLIYLTVLASVDQLTAQGINLIFFIPCALAAVLMSARQGLLETGTILRYALFGSVGVLLGNVLSSAVSGDMLTKLLGALLLIIGLRELFCPVRSEAV